MHIWNNITDEWLKFYKKCMKRNHKRIFWKNCNMLFELIIGVTLAIFYKKLLFPHIHLIFDYFNSNQSTDDFMKRFSTQFLIYYLEWIFDLAFQIQLNTSHFYCLSFLLRVHFEISEKKFFFSIKIVFEFVHQLWHLFN